eukprot:TRINITY_DN4318_c1_g1_i12.p1 TRINITY_DN4318_c1_g1~~TRINITY_DN4318_c1_g1_i12.p1  ORF type:complete len:251 (-),score=-16.98 TRINITY_DN4318_c1_g1_i12:1541-2293(-)
MNFQSVKDLPNFTLSLLRTPYEFFMSKFEELRFRNQLQRFLSILGLVRTTIVTVLHYIGFFVFTIFCFYVYSTSQPLLFALSSYVSYVRVYACICDHCRQQNVLLLNEFVRNKHTVLISYWGQRDQYFYPVRIISYFLSTMSQVTITVDCKILFQESLYYEVYVYKICVSSRESAVNSRLILDEFIVNYEMYKPDSFAYPCLLFVTYLSVFAGLTEGKDFQQVANIIHLISQIFLYINCGFRKEFILTRF